MTEQTQQYQIERPEPIVVPPTKITIPTGEDVANFAHPFAGPGTYQETAKQILENSQRLPTGLETAHLLHASYLGPEEFKSQAEPTEVRDKMGSNYFWIHNRNLWTDQGVYVLADPRGIGINEQFGKEAAIFVPKDSYNLGEHTPSSWAKDGFVRATFGEEGAELTAKLSEEFSDKPYLWGLDIEKGNEPSQRVSAVNDYCGRLILSGYDYGVSRGGFSSGVIL